MGRGIGEIFGIPLGELRGSGKDSEVMEGRRLFSSVGSEEYLFTNSKLKRLSIFLSIEWLARIWN
jgi:hypothetical protein